MTKLSYRKGSAAPSSVQKIGTRSTICRNYPTVVLAPPYLKRLIYCIGEIKCFCNANIAGLDEILVHQNLQQYGTISLILVQNDR